MIDYDCDTFLKDIDELYKKIEPFKPDIILAIARGGVTIGHFLSEKFNIRELYTLNSIHYDHQQKLDKITIYNIPKLSENKRVLVVDDIADSGETLKAVMEKLKDKFPNNQFKSATIFYKKDSIYQPDIKLKIANKWIHFFWTPKNIS